MEEGLKLTLGQGIFGGPGTYLVLVLTKADPDTKERVGEECFIGASGISSGKIILTLLAKVVALYVRYSMIEVRELGFKRIFLRAWFLAICLRLEEQIHAEFCDFLEVFLVYWAGAGAKTGASKAEASESPIPLVRESFFLSLRVALAH